MATEPLPSSLSAYRPTPNEKEAYSYLFNKADTDSLGVLTGDLAVPFFSHSSLPPVLLGEIWQIADPDNSGFLSPERFGVACRLIGHAQDRARTGAPRVEPSWVGQPGPLPTFKGSPIPAHLLPPSPQQQPPTPASPSPVSPPPASRIAPQTTGVDLNTVKPEDKAKYARLFAGANGGNVAGLLDGDKARDIFIKSNLPYETLGQIWNLADTHSRGSLDLTDFTIGMHLLQHVLNGHLGSTAAPNLPKVLDPKLYASAAGLPAPGVVAAATGGAVPASPLRQSSMPVSPPPAVTGAGAWVITPAEKAESDLWFDQLDTAVPKKGVLEGEQAVGFFGQSGLDVAVLAKVWDLADLRNEGHLNKDTFAVAMKLIRDKVANPTADLPESLPADFIPPSMRTGAPAAAPPVPTGPQRDLLDLMDDEAPAPPVRGASTPQPPGAFAPLQPQSTGSPLRSPLRTLSPQRTGSRAATLSPQATGSGSSFQPQGTIFPQATGGSTTTARHAQGTLSAQLTGQQQPQQSGFGGNFAPAPTSATFFDDNDDADTAANLSSLRSRAATLSSEQEQLTTQLSSTRQSREELESAVQSTTQQINELQSKVAASRASLETERSLLEDLKRRDAEQKAVLARARTELISAESDLSAVRMEKTEVEGEVLRDKEDVREVKRRLGMVEEEKRILREEVEKVRKEQRREKGLGAIARKQLATAEADRGRLEQELEEAKSVPAVDEVPEQPKEINPVAAAAVPLPITPGFTSPTASIRSNNPFDRLTAAAGVTPQSTGNGSSSSKNPFPSFSAPSPQPPTPAPEPATPSQATEAQTFPVAAAAAAVGTGALAAIGAAGAGLASALGVSHHPEEEEPAQESEDTTDPFGVPARTVEEEAAAADGFGDDFGASSFGAGFAAPAPNTEQVEGTLGEVPDDAGFDEAFEDLAAPAPAQEKEKEKEREVVEGKLGEVDPQAGFDEAFAEFGGEEFKKEETVEGALGHVEPGAGFEDAFKELKAEEPRAQEEVATEQQEEEAREEEEEGRAEKLDKDKGKEVDAIPAPEAEEEDVFGGAAARAIEDADDSDSSDDDEGPEDLDGAFGTRRSPPGPSTTAEQPESGHEPKTTSESDESYVHVPVPGTGTGTTESSQILEPPAPPAAPTQHRRAAPPPPTRPAAPPAQDDFESSFADMAIAPSSSSFATAVEAPVDAPTSAKQQPDFDSFDADFDFKPSFEDETPAAKEPTGAGSGSGAGTGSGSSEFDDAAFAEFDSSFPPVAPSSAGADAFPPVSSSSGPEPAGFSFDDSFGAPPFSPSPSPSTAAEPGPPMGLAPPATMVRRPSVGKGDARDDDSDDVKQICGMGFSREMAIEALAKYDHDLNRAINSLL